MATGANMLADTNVLQSFNVAGGSYVKTILFLLPVTIVVTLGIKALKKGSNWGIGKMFGAFR